ncbi:MAG: EAL domain-containing protein [Rhodoferax sp.]|nr:EAL domain-containing protein [Rhodoferax sp.]
MKTRMPKNLRRCCALYLQRKISLVDGTVVAAEALMRWQHPQRGLVQPMDFIPFAEQTRFVRQLTLWMFEGAAKVVRVLREGVHGSMRIAVNLSTRDLMDLELPARLHAILLLPLLRPPARSR